MINQNSSATGSRTVAFGKEINIVSMPAALLTCCATFMTDKLMAHSIIWIRSSSRYEGWF